MPMRNTRPADHGACGSTDDGANRPGYHRAGSAADRRSGDGSFSTARRIRCRGQGGQRRETRGDEKLAHVYPPHDQFEEERANTGKVRRVNEPFSLTGRNALCSNCAFERGFTFANKPNLYGVI